MASPARPGLPVPPELRRDSHIDDQQWIASGVFAVDLLCRTLSRRDLADVAVLDVGCGTKIVKTLLDGGHPVGRYVGIDVSPMVIDWLSANVSDPRFEFHRLDARNDLYNPGGTPLDEFEQLPVSGARFDLICLFSVFTHLAPDDYVSMLRLLRRHVQDDGRLLFSLFVDDPEYPSIGRALQNALASDDPALVAAVKAATGGATMPLEGRFVDEVPDKPLLLARYDEDYALELIDGTGWEVLSLNKPERPHIQHYIVCRPV